MRIRATWIAVIIGLLGLGLPIGSAQVAPKSGASAKPKASARPATKRVARGSHTSCDQTPIKIEIDFIADDDGLAWMDPDCLVACPGDTLIWKARNDCKTCAEGNGANPKKKRMEIGDRKVKYKKHHPNASPDFLEAGCRLYEEVEPGVTKTITCKVDANAAPGLYKYDVKVHGKNYDPEVEVQEAPPPPPTEKKKGETGVK